MMHRATHLGRLALELVRYSAINRVWWMVPLVVLIGALVLIAMLGQAAAPFTIYPMF